ncbi:MAG: GNAT family N-acetyltransferase [Hyphomicrobiales bacterium]|nr:GNAT family N-acetyltransferase [Hyphomicrobiales bacterium]
MLASSRHVGVFARESQGQWRVIGSGRKKRDARGLWTTFAGASASRPAFARPALALSGLGAPARLARFAFSPLLDSERARKRPLDKGPADHAEINGRLGSLEVRLARDARDLREAQRLRFRVFYEEMSALAHPMNALLRRDADRFDCVCDHLVVVDREDHSQPAIGGGSKVVGTYRLLRQDVAEERFGFYTSCEFDLAPLLAAHRDMRFLELGRSCVLASHRDKRTLELLWRAISAYVRRHRIDVMIGCASLEGTNPAALAEPLSLLHHHAPCPQGWEVRAHPQRHVPMNIVPKDVLDVKSALRSLPPLIRGYLRLGARFGDGAVIDRQFGTTDVFVLLRTSEIAGRYQDHFGSLKERSEG